MELRAALTVGRDPALPSVLVGWVSGRTGFAGKLISRSCAGAHSGPSGLHTPPFTLGPASR